MFQDIRRGINGSELGILIQEEKDVIKSHLKLVKEQAEASKYFAIWGKKDGSEDIVDISEKLWIVLDYITEAQTECIKKLEVHREFLKDIRTGEEQMDKLRQTEKSLVDKLKSATKAQKNTETISKQLENCRAQIAEKEALSICEKRRLLKQALHVKMDGIVEMSSKTSIAASYGKYLADQIPQGKLSPGQKLPAYSGKQTTQQILGDCLKSLKDWKNPNPSTFDSNYAMNRKMSSDSVTKEEAIKINRVSGPLPSYHNTDSRRHSYSVANSGQNSDISSQNLIQQNTTQDTFSLQNTILPSTLIQSSPFQSQYHSSNEATNSFSPYFSQNTSPSRIVQHPQKYPTIGSYYGNQGSSQNVSFQHSNNYDIAIVGNISDAGIPQGHPSRINRVGSNHSIQSITQINSFPDFYSQQANQLSQSDNHVANQSLYISQHHGQTSQISGQYSQEEIYMPEIQNLPSRPQKPNLGNPDDDAALKARLEKLRMPE